MEDVLLLYSGELRHISAFSNNRNYRIAWLLSNGRGGKKQVPHRHFAAISELHLGQGTGRRRSASRRLHRYNFGILGLVHSAFPVYLAMGPYTLHPHLLFESLSYLIGFRLYLSLRRHFGDVLVTPLRWVVIAAAVAGAAVGSKLLFLLEDPQLTMQNLHNPAYLLGGKTIVGALAGGLIAVELMKWAIGMRGSTGDLYAIPLAIGIAVGRIGCFLTGLADNTYGNPTSLPWGVDFGDGVLRHPTQIYEILFLLALVPVLLGVMKRVAACAKDTGMRRVFVEGDAFKLFMVAYGAFRLLVDFIKPYSRLFLGLGGIQWACVLILFYYSGDARRWYRVAVAQAKVESRSMGSA